MANRNTNLHKAKRSKDDEFYTTYETIEKELSYYVEQFRNKTVLCNCDNPYTSNFSKYFLNNFDVLGLKRLICTSFSPINYEQPDLFDDFSFEQKKGLIFDMVRNSSFSGIDISDSFVLSDFVKELKGNGDFRSDECIDYLKQCDIVVTNPPFSLFRDMVYEIFMI